MSETLSTYRPKATDPDEPINTGALEIIVNGPDGAIEQTNETASEQPDEVVDNRVASPFGALLERTAARISNFAENASDTLEQRAINKSHNAANRHERFLNIKATIRGIGKSALSAAKTGGTTALSAAKTGAVTGLGVGYIAGEAAVVGAKKAYGAGSELVATGKLQTLYAADTIKGAAETGALKTMYAADTVKGTIDTTVETAKSKLAEHADAAKSRRANRREKWANRKASLIEKGAGVVERLREEKRLTGLRVAAGRAAVSSFGASIADAPSAARQTYTAHADQNKLY